MSVEYDTELFRKYITEKSGERYVFEEDNTIKGYMTIGNCRDDDKSQSFELWDFYVDPLLIRSGVGTKLITFCESETANRGFKEIVLWVFEKNMVGRSFYEKNGYLPEGRKKMIDRFKEMELRYIKKL